MGSTNDLRRRFREHNQGKVFSTKFRILYARKRESNLKLRSRAFAQLKKRIAKGLIE